MVYHGLRRGRAHRGGCPREDNGTNPDHFRYQVYRVPVVEGKSSAGGQSGANCVGFLGLDETPFDGIGNLFFEIRKRGIRY